GVLGYAAMLAAWAVAERVARVERTSRVLLWSMAFVGVVLSAWLTFLEPFVIGATCAWCLASALLTTAILVAATAALPAAERSRPAGDGGGEIGVSPTGGRRIPAGAGARNSHP